MQLTNWHVITGGPGTGKTVLIEMLSRLGYTTVPEAAKTIIDEGLASGKTLHDIRGDEYKWQSKILERILANEAAAKSDRLTFFDRGAQDGLAHLAYYNLTPGEEWNKIKVTHPYKTVFLLEPLDDVAKDYFRVEDQNFTQQITAMMDEVYRRAGATPIRVPAMAPEKRLAFVLQHIGLPAPR